MKSRFNMMYDYSRLWKGGGRHSQARKAAAKARILKRKRKGK